MAQQLKALAALAEDPGLVPSTHIVANNHLQLQFQDISGLCRHLVHTWYTDRHKASTHKIKINFLSKREQGTIVPVIPALGR